MYHGGPEKSNKLLVNNRNCYAKNSTGNHLKGRVSNKLPKLLVLPAQMFLKIVHYFVKNGSLLSRILTDALSIVHDDESEGGGYGKGRGCEAAVEPG